MMTEMLLLLFRLLRGSLLSLRVFSIFFFSSLGGAPNIDLLLPKFSLAKSVLTLLFSISTLLVERTKTVALVEAILEEENSYPKPVWLEADFWMLSISSSFALEVLSNWALTWNSYASSFLVFSAKKLFSNHNAPMVWLASSNFMEISSRSSSISLSILVANLYNFSCSFETFYNFS